MIRAWSGLTTCPSPIINTCVLAWPCASDVASSIVCCRSASWLVSLAFCKALCNCALSFASAIRTWGLRAMVINDILSFGPRLSIRSSIVFFALSKRLGATSVACMLAEVCKMMIVSPLSGLFVKMAGRARTSTMKMAARSCRSSSGVIRKRCQGRLACRSCSACCHINVLPTTRSWRLGRIK